MRVFDLYDILSKDIISCLKAGVFFSIKNRIKSKNDKKSIGIER